MPIPSTVEEPQVDETLPAVEDTPESGVEEETAAEAPKTARKKKGKKTDAKPAEAAEASEEASSEPVEDLPKPKKRLPKKLKKTATKDDPSGGREPVYTEIEAVVFEGSDALTEDLAKEILGWTVGTEEHPLNPNDVHFTDYEGNAVHCANVAKHQRSFYRTTYNTIMYDILKGQWQFNGEVFSLGRHGWLINGKHRLVAFVLACQKYRQNPAQYPEWSSEPTLSIIGIYGVLESQRVVQTIDTGKPRTLADSIFSSGHFDGLAKSQLLTLCRMTDHAVRLLWNRTGANADAYNPVVSHTDAMMFLDRHPTILACVRNVFDEDEPMEDGGGKRLSSLVSPGYMSGLLYLMTTQGDSEKYDAADYPNESLVDMGRIEQAEQFLTLLAGGDKNLAAVRKVIVEIAEEGTATPAERIGVIIKAFNAWLAKGKVTPAQVRVKSEVDELTGAKALLEFPVIDGGIDRGPTATT